MINHEVEVAQISKRYAGSGEERRAAVGSIIVKPPITCLLYTSDAADEL